MADDNKSDGIGGGWVFLIVVLLILALAAVAWVVWSRMRARRLGLPPPSLNPFAARSGGGSSNYPSPAPGGIRGWIDTQIRNFKNRRSATGAYEATGLSSGHPNNRPRGTTLDPDEAWDSRVGNEADIYNAGPGGYYEEQELGLHAPSAYQGGGYGAPSPGLAPAYEEERGRSRSRSPAARELDQRYDEEMGRRENPFGDNVERSDISLRGVSPRPLDTRVGGGKNSDEHESPTERRSMFRENM